MAVKDIFKISRKTFFNPSAWLGLKELGAYTRIIGDNLKTTFTQPKPQYTETFEQALKRLNVTETDLQHNARNYKLYALIFLILSVIALIGGFYYLFKYGTFAGWILATMVALLLAVQAFRFDFWYFQIKHRKLGCTFDEWWREKSHLHKGPPT
ncbi:MAG: hypothetical protein K0S27_753 [Gammaproteobacteria bacterium]|jgi:intracellular multiplication protein IcmV|nr:hypothetical protein [Gammaproteobacteria bacterium]